MNADHIKNELINALINDRQIDFKKKGNELRDGICPSCGEKELFVRLDQPFRVQCRRYNKCNYSASTRSLYPDIFENLSKKYPATETNPNATADAYLVINRHFDLAKLNGMYSQGVKKLKNGSYAETVRFSLWDQHYYERIIDADKVAENEGDKAHISYAANFAGKAWIPKGMSFNNGDTIYITEGVFKSLAFLHLGKKSISSLSCSNLPREVIKEHSGKKITWILAADNDKAGISYTEKYRKEIHEMGETVLAAFPEHEKIDWDDEYRNGKLTDKYLEESIWRGYYLLADKPQAKAFYHWARFKSIFHVFDFHHFLYRAKINPECYKALSELAISLEYIVWSKARPIELSEMIKSFSEITEIEKIANCFLDFKYLEVNSLTKEQKYVFKIISPFKNPTKTIGVLPSALKSPEEFCNAIRSQSHGGRFEGDKKDLKYLEAKWFDRQIKSLETFDFIGYSQEHEAYVFKDFGYKKGALLQKSDDDFIICNEQGLKTDCDSINIVFKKNYDFSWFQDYKEVFSTNGIILMSWWLGSLFAEQVRKKQQSWPFFELTGVHASGKSSMIRFMWNCCGRPGYEGEDPFKSSPVGRARLMQQVANLPVVFLEGDRDNGTSKKFAFNLDEFKTAYDGGYLRTIGIKSQGSKTVTPKFRGALLVSQNAQVDGSPALLSRLVHCHSTREHFTPSSEKLAEKIKASDPLKYCGWLPKVLENETKILSSYFPKYKEIREKFLKSENKIKEDRIIDTHSQVAAFVWQLPLIVGNDFLAPEECQATEDFIFKRAVIRDNFLCSDHPVVQLFWDIYRDLNWETTEDKWGGKKLTETLNHSCDDEIIAINLNHFLEAASRHNLERMSALDLKKLLPASRLCKFLDTKSVKSKIWEKAVHCWTFKNTFKN